MSNKIKEIKAYFKMTEAIAELSYCTRLKVGSIIVKNNRVISYGYNGTVSGDENVCENDEGKTKNNVIHSEILNQELILLLSIHPIIHCLFDGILFRPKRLYFYFSRLAHAFLINLDVGIYIPRH